MRLLLDTQMLIRAVLNEDALNSKAREALENPENELLFSLVSLWEIAIKFSLNKPSFTVNPKEMREAVSERGFEVVGIEGDDVVAVADLPRIHGDPFDRLLIAQAINRNVILITSDRNIARYIGPIWRV